MGPRNFSFLPMFLCFHLRPACFSDSWNRSVSGLPLFGWTPTAVKSFGKPGLFLPWFSHVFQAKMESDLLPFSDASTTDADSMSRCSRCVQLDEAWKHSRFYSGWWWNSDTRSNDQNNGFLMDSVTIQWIHHWFFNVFSFNIYIMGFTWAIGDISIMSF